MPQAYGDRLLEGKPSSGTHINIENRSLNDEFDSFGEAAGACGWYLGALDPSESVLITVVFMFSHGEPVLTCSGSRMKTSADNSPRTSGSTG